MTKEALEKEAREYIAEHSEYSEVFGQTFVAVDTLTAMVDFAEPREKQIQIDAEQILALQRQKGELTDELTKKSDTNHQLVEQLAERNEKLIKAKELIENIIRVTWGEGWNYSLDWKVKAEQFLKE